MPVPSTIDDLSQTAGSNSPAGSESPTSADDYLRSAFSFLALLRDGKGHADEVQVASAATCDIGGANSPFVEVTGTTTITSFGTNYNGPRFIRFSGVLTLTHNASTVILPGGANITTAAGDTAVAIPNGGTPNGWRVVVYTKIGIVPGTASSLTGTLGLSQGGTGASYASNAALFAGIKQAATDSATGVVELATDAEAQAGTSTSVVLTPANMKAAQIQLGTPVTLTNQTSVDFTGIPSWANRVTLFFDGVSTNGTSIPQVQIGDSGGVETSGYAGSATTLSASATSALPTTGNYLLATAFSAASIVSGRVVIERVTGNTWCMSSKIGFSSSAATGVGEFTKTLSATLDRVRLTTVNGTDQFDAGTVNVSWE